MSTLILQIDIGDGTQWLKDKSINPIRNTFIPSIKRYAKKNGYDYKLITTSVYEKKYGNFDFLATKEKHYSFERYFHIKQNYDAIVYIDNDIYAFDNAKPFPNIKGIMNVAEPEGKSSKIFRENYNQKENTKYYNSGVTMLDKEAAFNLQDYMIRRMELKKRAAGKNTDNMMLNEYILENKNIFTEVGAEWNYMPFLPNSIKIDNPNFFHFIGISGKYFLDFIQKNSDNLEYTLNNMLKIKNKD